MPTHAFHTPALSLRTGMCEQRHVFSIRMLSLFLYLYIIYVTVYTNKHIFKIPIPLSPMHLGFFHTSNELLHQQKTLTRAGSNVDQMLL